MVTKDQLNAITKIAKSRTLPILNTIKFEPGKMTATDLDLAVIIEDKAIEKTGYVNPAKLKKSGLATIQKHWDLVNITEHAAEDWPELPPHGAPIELNQATVSGMIDALVTVSRDETRPVLNCIELKPNGTITSTDGFRLITKNGGHDLTALIPYQAIELMKMLKTLDGWQIGQNEDTITLKNGGLTIIAKNIEGNYPDWIRLLPTTIERRVKVKSSLVYEALDLIEGGVIRLDQNGGIYVQSGEREGEKRSMIAVVKPELNIKPSPNNMHVIMPLKGTSPTTQVLLNSRYVKDAIGKSDYMQFSFSGGLQPVVVEGISQ